MNTVRRLLSDERGSVAVEFAAVAVALIVLVVGAVEVGRGLYLRNAVAHAADNGVRLLLLDAGRSNSEVESGIRAAFHADAPAALGVSVAAETIDGVAFRTITVSYPFTPLVPQLSIAPLTFTLARRVPLA
jgi:Flp pilus assembly protein TadG